MERIATTSRLRVRPLTESDFEDYRRLLALPAVAAANGSSSDVDRAVMARWFAADRQSPFAFAVTDLTTARFMGVILFYRHDDPEEKSGNPQYDVGYFLDPVDWGQGIMPEALKASLHLVQRATVVTQTVWATCLVTNRRSQGVLTKLGFQTVTAPFVPVGLPGEAAQPELLWRLDLPGNEKSEF
ncbi:MAG: GNAT family N-acetyltransferase [Levilactobacillus brevis]|jgi:RimJ/RimL family protein N-acetyltransferase|uniref:GNAT family N-acetyltransferase n=1 Tax=Levilactobacillus brevis TaxID=1580 RepID=UPI0012E944EB|nr:GNAT family N-acetyltransferase [Levilactobacillus brevis]MUV40366.1 GNAT family N-acetyltransferase [Levilactobacillus brevis]